MLRIHAINRVSAFPFSTARSLTRDLKSNMPIIVSRPVFGFIPAQYAQGITHERPMGRRLQCICGERVAALAGPPALTLPAPNKVLRSLRRLRTHQQMLENVMRRVPVLPVHFATQLPNRQTIRRFLRENDERLLRAIDVYGHLLQLEVLVSCRGPQPGGCRAAAAREQIRLELRRRSLAIREEAVDGKDTLLWATVLFRSLDEPRIDAVLARLHGEYDGWLHIKCVGPLPPCRFARARVLRELPSSSDEPRWTLTLNPAPPQASAVLAAIRGSRTAVRAA